MSTIPWFYLAALFGLLALAGCAYTLFAALCVRRFAARPQSPPRPEPPGVTLLKPLSSAEPGLDDNLRSFCAQHYAGPVQMLLGVAADEVEAGTVARRLCVEASTSAPAPGTARLRLEVTPCADAPAIANPKIGKLAAMMPHAAHDVIVASDSDIVVAPDYLARITAELAADGVGLVTCLYRGLPRGRADAAPTPWSRLAAMQIDHHFLPSVLVGAALRLARPCFGSTMALSRATLARIGGFAAFGGHLADDHAVGEAVRRRGLAVVVSREVVGHACPERSLHELLHHELRWARTVRAIDPWGYAGSLVAHPLPLALLAACTWGLGAWFAPASPAAVWSVLPPGLLVLALGCRLALARTVDAALRIPHHHAWLGPLRDALSFLVFLGGFFVGVVSWRGRRYRVGAGGTVEALPDTRRLLEP